MYERRGDGDLDPNLFSRKDNPCGSQSVYQWLTQLFLSAAVAFISGELTAGSVQCESRIYLAYSVTRCWQCLPSTNKT